MKNKKYLFLALLLLTVLACQSTSAALSVIPEILETGNIAIIEPASNSVSHDDVLTTSEGLKYNVVTLKIRSTFKETKPATILLDGKQLVNYSCDIVANTDTLCSVPIFESGPRNFVVTVSKRNGDVVSASTVFIWQPYSAMDKTALKWSGDRSISLGYGLMVGITMLAFVLLLSIAGIVVGYGRNDLVEVLGQFAMYGFYASVLFLVVFLSVVETLTGKMFAVGIVAITVLVFTYRHMSGKKKTTLIVSISRGDVTGTAHFITEVNDGSNELGLKALDHAGRLAEAIEAQLNQPQSFKPSDYMPQPRPKRKKQKQLQSTNQ